MADNPYVNRVETGDGDTIMDITDTTATPGDVVTGQVFYASSGARSVGSLASKEAEQGGTDLSLVTTGEKYDWNSKANQSDLNDKADKTDTVLNTTLSRGRKANSTVGTGSLAFGNDVVAMGQYSHAEGVGGTFVIGNDTFTSAAGGQADHTEGYRCMTLANTSFGNHAEGYNTRATGGTAHAEGYRTLASGSTSHTEGTETTASAANSHAEGHLTTASGTKAHAEGFNTKASADCSHAEGASTTASGLDSHSEGAGTIASGSCAHAEGSGSRATENYTHAEGIGTLASGSCSHSEGGGTIASGSNSHAEGGGTTASGALSHAEGGGTTASAQYAHAEGASTRASGIESHAEGLGGTYTRNNSTYTSESAGVADHTEGYMCRTASGASIMPGNHAEGYQTSATGGSSHSEGSSTTASGENAHAEGGSTVASGTNSHAEGASTTASGADSHAEGAGSQATNYQAHAEGAGTIAAGQASHAEGASTNASDYCSHAEGYYTVANGTHAHAEGNNTTASGEDAHAEGSGTTASGKWSHAEGSGTTASGRWSHAEGGGTVASGSNSHAEGENSVANHKNQHVFGSWNIADPSSAQSNDRGNYVEIVGNGTSSIAKSNARTLDWSGNERISGDLYVGCNSDSSGGTKIEPVNNTTVLSALGTSSSGTRFLREDGTWQNAGGGGDVSSKADKVTGATSGNLAGLDANGNLTDSGSKPSDFLTSHQDISGKADKVTGATSGNFASLDSNGNLTDSGKNASDFTVSVMTGASSSSAGASGLVPQPVVGDQIKFLCGDGTWKISPYMMYGAHYVEGDSNDSVGTWTGTLENLTAYYNGLTVIYVPKVAGASTTTLNLNNIGAITCYTTNTTKLDTQYTPNTPILFTYYDGYWRRADNDVNTTTISNLYHHYGNYVAESAIYRYQILFEKSEDKLTPITSANNDTGTSKTMLTNVEFNAFGRIFYYVSATTVEANGSVSAGSLCFAHESFNARYTLNCGTTLTAHKNLYLVVTPTSGNMCKIASSSPWAQELPSTNDGNWYILLGRTYSTYQATLYPNHPVYMYDGTKVVQVMPNGFTASVMKGAGSSSDGASGLVPKPVAGDQTKFLRGDGTWHTVSGGGGGATIDDTAGAGDTDKAWSADKLTTEFGRKADTVASATSGNFAGLDSNGNLVDSGSKASDFLTSHQDISGKADKVTSATSGNFASLDSNGNLTDSGHKHSDYLTSHQDISGKADKADTVLTTTLSRGRKENTTVGTRSFAFGDNVTATATNSTAIGSTTTASGFCSVAEGDNTTASGYYSHAQGSHTIAQRSSQFVFGEYNVADTEGNSGSYSGKYIEIVGNGESTSRSNARALDWDGNEYLRGDLYVGCDKFSTDGTKIEPVNQTTVLSALGTSSSGTRYLREDGTWQPVSGGGGATIDDTAGSGDTDKAWSADKLTTEFSGKADIVSSATSGNFAALDANGNLTDSGYTATDFAGSKPVTIQLDTVTNTSGSYSHTTTNADVTADMKPIRIECSDPSIFGSEITVTTNDGSITLTCSSVAGTSSVSVVLMKELQPGESGSDFDVLSGRIGTLSQLETTDKTNLVNAINEVNTKIYNYVTDGNTTSIDITVKQASMHFLIIQSNATSAKYVGFVYSGSTEATFTDVFKGTSVTMTSSQVSGNNVITYNVGSTARKLYIIDILMYGDPIVSIE